MIRTACAILCILIASNATAEPPFPLLYDVANVAQDDKLNIRAAPSASADIIGVLPPGARDVEIVDQSDGGDWLKLNIGERSGWAAARYLAAQPRAGDRPPLDRPLACFGVEPFWSLTLSPNGASSFSPFGEDETQIDTGPLTKSANRNDRFVAPFSGQGAAFLAQRSCGDGMSDRSYAIEITLTWRDSVLSGCCRIAP